MSEEDQLTERGAGYTFFWKGKAEGVKREGGVGFAVRTEIINQLEQPYGISDRIMCLRAPLSCGRYMTVISVYAPTLVSNQESIMAFYQDLRDCVTAIPKADKILILGDFNARVGSDHYTWDPLGRFGLGKVNDNGLLLLQLCTEFQLAVCNTFYQQKVIHKVTWIHPRSKHGHILDYIITRKRDLQDVCTVRVMRGAECGTDHKLVRAKIKMRIRKKIRTTGVKVPKRIDVSKLQNKEVRETLSNTFDNIIFDGTWEHFKTQVYTVGVDVLGLKKSKHRDWFDENDAAITKILEEKNKLHEKLLSAEGPAKNVAEKAFKEAKSRLQHDIRQMKNNWWSEVSAEMQRAYDCKDSKALYSTIRQAFGPQPSTMVPLKSKDGSALIKDAEGIMARWTEHYTDLFDNPSTINEAVINGLPQKDILAEMMTDPSVDEIKSTIREVNTGKAPGLDGIPVELLRFGGDNLAVAIQAFILAVWHGDSVPQDWIDAIMVSLYKGKGSKSECGDHRGISLLEAVGKVLSKILLNRLTKWGCPAVIPESQCGFRAGRGTMDMIFSARQLMEKCIEQQVPLYQVFIDLTKAFDTINRSALWTILGKLGCPSEFVAILKQLHRNMKARVNFNGSLSEPVPVDNGVKQGDIPAPTLFSIYFAVMLEYAFKDCDVGVYIRFRTSGKVFNLRRFNSKSKTFQALVRELLYADDADLVAHTEEDMQMIMDKLSSACTAFGLTISLKKTYAMYTPPIGLPYVEPNIMVEGKRLKVTDSFVYLGSTLSRDGTLDAEINQRIAKANTAFGKLEKRVWSDRGITTNTKLSVYEACVLTALLYGSETWTTYRRHVKLLDRFHQNCIRRILNIRWMSNTPDTVVLERASSTSIEMRVMRNQMRWAGHLVRMKDERIPKQLFYGELSTGKRPQHKPRKRFKDVLKSNLKALQIDVDNWEAITENRPTWRKLVRKGCSEFEEKRVERAVLKRALRKQDESAVPVDVQEELKCNVCGRFLLSRAGLINHLKSHNQRQNQSFYEEVLPPRPPMHSCPTCGLVCKSAGGLTRHSKIHKDVPQPAPSKEGKFKCYICECSCKTEAGLKSHLRAHGRAVIK